MSYRAWRSCECVYIRLVLRVRPRSKARGDKMCKKKYKAEQNCPEKWAEGADRQMCVSSAVNPFSRNNCCMTSHYNCTQALSRGDVDAAGCAILVRSVAWSRCIKTSATRSCERRGAAAHVRHWNLFLQRLCSRWKLIADRQESARGFLQHDGRLPVFWLGVGLGSQSWWRHLHLGFLQPQTLADSRHSIPRQPN